MSHRNGIQADQGLPILRRPRDSNMHSAAQFLHDYRRDEYHDRSYEEQIPKRPRPADEELPSRYDLRREQFASRLLVSRSLPKEFGLRDCDLPVRRVNR
jgi:hypothetical protein